MAVRLRRVAAYLDQRADQVMEEEAHYAGLAAGRRRDGDPIAARAFDRLQADRLAVYRELDERSFQLKLRACELEVRSDLAGVAASVTSFGLPRPT